MACIGTRQFADDLIKGEDGGLLDEYRKQCTEWEELKGQAENGSDERESDPDTDIVSEGEAPVVPSQIKRERDEAREVRQGGNSESMEALHGHTDDQPRSNSSCSPVDEENLVTAAATGYDLICDCVLRQGANVNYHASRFGTAIHAAVRQGHTHVVRRLLDEKSLDVNIRDTLTLQTALAVAARQGYEDIVKLLLTMRSDIDPNAGQRLGRTPLRWTCTRDYNRFVRLIPEHPDTDVNCKGSWRSQSPVIEAAWGNHGGVLRLLLQDPRVKLESGTSQPRISLFAQILLGMEEINEGILHLLLNADPTLLNGAPDQEQSPLYAAALVAKSIPMVRFLLSQPGIDANAIQERRRYTVLHEVIEVGHADMVRELLRWDNGNPDIGDPDMLPVHLAITSGHHEVVKALLESDRIDVNWVNRSGKTALAEMCSTVYPPGRRLDLMFEYLLQRPDIIVDKPDDNGETALYGAAARGRVAFVRVLLEREDVNAEHRTRSGSTPLLAAARGINRGSLAIVRLLLDRPEVDPAHRDENGRDVLFLAGASLNTPVFRFLLERDQTFDPNLQDVYGGTLLHQHALIDEWFDTSEIIQMLLERDDVNLQIKDNKGFTPIEYARQMGNQRLLQMLTEKAAGGCSSS
ncbi:ankyrin repeat-containing domain protein [Aspergillus karnatakaensis]|uniref:ankyrin repeat domain-containing protein n=1 Tax=Aspergillus karnatakaensis TaxID=1810916 RepID=UPI003CCDB979